MKRSLVCMISAGMLWMMAPSSLNAQSHPSGAGAVVERLNTALLEAMKRAEELGYSGRYKLLEPVVRESFAFPFMARKSTGIYWKGFHQQQREQLMQYYVEWSVATYAKRFDQYTGQKFEVVSTSASPPGNATVISHLIKADGEKVEFHYRLRDERGAWRIVDIQVRGVSQLAMTRSQFVGILEREGFDGLINSLKDKIRELSENPG